MIEELLKTASLLKTVPVTGDYWIVMHASVNTILKVVEELKRRQNEIDNKHNSEPAGS